MEGIALKVYIAGPLFNEMERQWNLRIDRLVRKLGVETYLPQRDGGEAVELVKAGGDPDEVSRRLFELDLKELSTCDVLVMVLDGRVPDEGACVELGMAHALGKKVYWIPDRLSFIRNGTNQFDDRIFPEWGIG